MYNQLRALHGLAPVPAERAANHKAKPFAGDVPKCFTRRQWEIWKKSAREASPGPIGPCADCTPGRKSTMKQAGRCERPEVRFRYDADGFIEGFWPSEGRRKHRRVKP